MKANELRIGNIIGMDLKEFPQNYFKVFEVADKSMKVSDSWLSDEGDFDYYDADLMEGIPLTDQWLLRCGFYFWCDELGVKAYYKIFGIEYFCVATNGFWQLRGGLNDKDGAWRMGNNYPFIKYIHQLQNLYFSLTGEELTIKN